MSEPITVGSTPTFEAAFTRDGAAWDLTGATVTFYLKKPDGTLLTRTPTITNAVGGIAAYQALTTDLDVKGTWRNAWKVVGGGQTFVSGLERLQVEAVS
jgi:uncharacterized protein YfaS (alpha-2-macroglobulin family)